MATLVLARDGVLFLIAWEMMSVASFFLVTYEGERDDVRRAGMTYLIASHLGAVFLFILFGLLSRETGSFDFDSFARAGASNSDLSNVCFLLALLGFGTKAGFWPLHIWLPDAHPAAPSHVSALMSGVNDQNGYLRPTADNWLSWQPPTVVGSNGASHRRHLRHRRRPPCVGPT
jgi:formate hydrogenlyase subunit 3/multisubunit Na+/H+ antiporter MnhD subunit